MILQVVLAELPLVLVLTSLLRAKDYRLVALSNICVFVRYHWWRLIIYIVVAYAAGYAVIVMILAIVHGHCLSWLVVKVCSRVRPLIESERLWLSGHRSLRIPSSGAIWHHLVATRERIKININCLHAQQFAADLPTFASGIAGLWLLWPGDRILLHKRFLCLRAIPNQGLDVLLFFADLLPILRGIVRVADHHVRRVELVDGLVARRHISVVLYRTLAVRSRLLIFGMFRAANRRVHLRHIQLQIFSFCRCFAGLWRLVVTLDWVLGVEADPRRFLLKILLRRLAAPWDISAHVWTVALLPRDLQAHETWHCILTQIYWRLIRIWFLLLRAIFMLESMNILSDNRQVTLVTHVRTRHLWYPRDTWDSPGAISIFIITPISQIIIKFRSTRDTTFEIVNFFRPSLLWPVSFVDRGHAESLF